MSSSLASAFLGYVSMGCWIVATVPQILENWRNKSTDGLAPGFVLIWVAGDLLNLLGSWWQHVLRSMIILAAYYVSQDLILIFQMIHYRNASQAQKSGDDTERDALLPRSRSPSPSATSERTARVTAVLQNTALFVFVLSVGVLGTVLDDRAGVDEDDVPWNMAAQVMGYGSMVLYLFARVPQILKNRVTHCEGLAAGMFVLSAIANTTYLASILAKSLDPEYIRINLSWIIGSGGCVFLDFVVLSQFAAYART
ncbi:PQ-loop-domain-containing protein [Exidia glandulosa HHB12029]|uniref:PQ-loop-domain-containing protein n=1 Tax=Exidia glandulosa HHB12029 TaxID=1314781 RepID=A0A165GC55_EXIGL|nr:PQ-loop-domain-containing protein [Exidia glandulosa HHB12029]KZV90295.1 PQ-loop-domain-containing protein [Exidia glandulosa HHB12029]